MKDLSICSIIVTYGNRWHMLQQVIKRLLDTGIRHIVITDNASSPETENGLHALHLSHPGVFHVLRFSTNQGTAAAMKAALDQAKATGASFIFIVDDDNLPALHTPGTLHQTFHQLSHSNGNRAVALQADREGRRTRSSDGRVHLLPPHNAFMGFSLTKIIQFLKERISKTSVVIPEQRTDTLPLLDAAAYGGLFFPSSLLAEIPPPDTSYVLYMDDFDFTLGMIRRGTPVYLVPGAPVTDLEPSYYFPTRKGWLYHSALAGPNISTIYYSLRNNVWFTQKYLLTNRLLYIINKYTFYALITLLAILNGKPGRLRTIFNAGMDAEKGKMGWHPRYPLPSATEQHGENRTRPFQQTNQKT